MRFFNTAGPVEADIHYCIPPLERLDAEAALELVRMHSYFVLHAPRQTGKTSSLLALRDLLNERGYRCVYASIEEACTTREDTSAAVRTVLGVLASEAKTTLGDGFPEEAWPEILERHSPHRALLEALSAWAAADAKPLVLLIDEIDALEGDSLLSVLAQIRAGFTMRPKDFPQSMALCGLRDVRDYCVGPKAGPFNIVTESVRLSDFTREQTVALLGQHTADTGQAFAPEALDAVWAQTRGQPWLVNALAWDACFENAANRDRERAVTADDIDAARERLIVSRTTHLNDLTDTLRDERVRRVIAPMLAGGHRRASSGRDLEYVRALGLIARDAPVRIANPIYAEVVPRKLAWLAQEVLEEETARYVGADGGLDVETLLTAFQDFFRRHSEHWRNRFEYPEAWPQLLLQAFLQRVVNGGGRIEREYGLGRGRVDLLIVWPQGGRVREYAIECKVVRDGGGLESALAEGAEQTARYMDRCGAEAGHLVVFDRRENRSWDEKIFRRRLCSEAGAAVEAWGM